MIKMYKILSVVLLMSVVTTAVNAQVSKDTLDQSADQSQGNYASTNLNYLGGGGSLGMIQSAWKDPLQHMGEGQTRPGYTKYYWTPDLVLPLRVREGMYTLINFPNWEIIENVYIGDTKSFQAEINGPTSLLVYPNASSFVGVDTNMIVFGRSGNKYVFYMQSETFNTDRITNAIIDIEVLDNNKGGSLGNNLSSGYQGGNSGSTNSGAMTYTSNLQKEDWIQKIPVDPTQFRFDIEVYVPNPDDIIIAPERVWRDNIFTYIDLGEKSLTAVQRPIVTLIVERSETPVGFRAAGPNNRLIIVEGMGDMVLRSGKRMVCLKLRRADTDGLENAVYAPSNEWDVQNRYASQRDTNEKTSNEPINENEINDVYYSDDTASSKEEKGWFDSFFKKENKNKQNDSNEMMNVEEILAEYNKVTKNVPSVNDIPKVVPIVGESITPDKAPVDQVKLNVGKGAIIVPEYTSPERVENVQEDVKNSADIINRAVENVNQSNLTNQNTIQNNVIPEDDILMTSKTRDILSSFKQNKGRQSVQDNSSISIELGTDQNINNLERLWSDISKNYPAVIGKYEPFYSVDTPADGQGREVFHLRVGPIRTIEDGDRICSQLGVNGIICSVVRIR